MSATTSKLHLNYDAILTSGDVRRTLVVENGGARMFLRSAVAAVFALLAAPSLVQAQQTEAYFYDVHGRVQAVTRAPANGGARTLYSLDNADNRDSRSVVNVSIRMASDRLSGGEWLLPSQRITSADNRFYLTLQSAGNAVIYGPSGPLWGTETAHGSSTALVMQADGNLVIRGAANEPLWASGTNGYPGSVLVMQSDGNLVLYSGATPIWATNTCCH